VTHHQLDEQFIAENTRPDTDALLATVRRCLPRKQLDYSRGEVLDPLAALDSLAAELERVKQDRDDADLSAQLWRDAVERVKAERDALRDVTTAEFSAMYQKWDRTAARLDKALSALREIADGEKVLGQSPAFLREVARAAIAEIEGEA